MSKQISIKKLKRIMYGCLRWRLQLGSYIPHNPIPDDYELGEFSRGVKCAYKDLLRAIEEIEVSENQSRFFKRTKRDWYMYGDEKDDSQSETYVDEMRWK